MKHSFVENIPEKLDVGVLYVSIEYDTAVHLCACGCGCEVVTPLSPAEWAFEYNGKSVSLSPSIGNWGFPCKSHYWIKKGKIEWAASWSSDKIDAVRDRDAQAKMLEYKQLRPKATVERSPEVEPISTPKNRLGLLLRMLKKFGW